MSLVGGGSGQRQDDKDIQLKRQDTKPHLFMTPSHQHAQVDGDNDSQSPVYEEKGSFMMYLGNPMRTPSIITKEPESVELAEGISVSALHDKLDELIVAEDPPGAVSWFAWVSSCCETSESKKKEVELKKSLAEVMWRQQLQIEALQTKLSTQNSSFREVTVNTSRGASQFNVLNYDEPTRKVDSGEDNNKDAKKQQAMDFRERDSVDSNLAKDLREGMLTMAALIEERVKISDKILQQKTLEVKALKKKLAVATSGSDPSRRRSDLGEESPSLSLSLRPDSLESTRSARSFLSMSSITLPPATNEISKPKVKVLESHKEEEGPEIPPLALPKKNIFSSLGLNINTSRTGRSDRSDSSSVKARPPLLRRAEADPNQVEPAAGEIRAHFRKIEEEELDDGYSQSYSVSQSGYSRSHSHTSSGFIVEINPPLPPKSPSKALQTPPLSLAASKVPGLTLGLGLGLGIADAPLKMSRQREPEDERGGNRGSRGSSGGFPGRPVERNLEDDLVVSNKSRVSEAEALEKTYRSKEAAGSSQDADGAAADEVQMYSNPMARKNRPQPPRDPPPSLPFISQFASSFISSEGASEIAEPPPPPPPGPAPAFALANAVLPPPSLTAPNAPRPSSGDAPAGARHSNHRVSFSIADPADPSGMPKVYNQPAKDGEEKKSSALPSAVTKFGVALPALDLAKDSKATQVLAARKALTEGVGEEKGSGAMELLMSISPNASQQELKTLVPFGGMAPLSAISTAREAQISAITTGRDGDQEEDDDGDPGPPPAEEEDHHQGPAASGKSKEQDETYEEFQFREQTGNTHRSAGMGVTVLLQLVQRYKDQGKYDQAEPLNWQCVNLLKERKGEEHPDTLACMDSLSECFYRQGKYKEVELLCRETLDIREYHFGPSHPDTLATMDGLVLFFLNLHAAGDTSDPKRLEKATTISKESLQRRRDILGEKHPDTKLNEQRLIGAYEAQGRPDLAAKVLASR